jgi:hypothetical protein
MMIDIDDVFEECVHTEPFSKECLELLERIMNIDNPMRFDDSFTTDKQLNQLEEELECLDRKSPRIHSFRDIVVNARPCLTDSKLFI